ncbi:MAG: class I SAM-dependent methyltransferase [Candidatus Rokuibacteriota bacterium]
MARAAGAMVDTAGERAPDYTSVTEVPGVGASREQLARLYTRYAVAASHCARKDVLEVACGAGPGLGYLASRAARVVGGDYTESLLRVARVHYGTRIPLVRLDAQALPFRAEAFDVVILYEALYYLKDADLFVGEARRILRPAGTVLVCSVNPEWPGFNPSPFSRRYFSARDLRGLLGRHGFGVEIHAAFPAARDSARDRLVSLIKRAAVAAGAVPRTMKGKRLLKRIFFGSLAPIPPEITEGMAAAWPLVSIAAGRPAGDHKLIFATGRKTG